MPITSVLYNHSTKHTFFRTNRVVKPGSRDGHLSSDKLRTLTLWTVFHPIDATRGVTHHVLRDHALGRHPSEPALAAGHGLPALDHAEPALHRQEGQFGPRQPDELLHLAVAHLA